MRLGTHIHPPICAAALLFCSFVPASGLLGKQLRRSACGSRHDLKDGSWVPISLPDAEVAAPLCPAENGSATLTYEPVSCKLPRANLAEVCGLFAVRTSNRTRTWFSFDRTLPPPRIVRFIGDSTTEGQFKHLVSCTLKSSQLPNITQHKDWYGDSLMVRRLRAAGFSKETSEIAADHMVKANHEFMTYDLPNCEGSIDTTRMNALPKVTRPPLAELAAAVFHAKVFFGRKPLGPQDIVVFNSGLHYPDLKSRTELMVEPLTAIFRHWSKLQKRGMAPRLVWRETSPQHWGGMDGHFTGRPKDFASCLPVPPDTVEAWNLWESERQILATALAATNMHVPVVPVFWPSLARYDEHTFLKQGGALVPDCTHWKRESSALRLWDSSLLSVLKEVLGK